MHNTTATLSVSMSRDIHDAMMFISEIEKAIVWLKNNVERYSDVVSLPVYLDLEVAKKRRINFLAMKKWSSFLNKAETEEFHQAVAFCFKNKDTFKFFNSEMLTCNIKVHSTLEE